MLYTACLLLTAIAMIILLSVRFRFNVFFVLIAVAVATGLMAGLEWSAVLAAIKSGLGSTIEKIGLLIILGIVLGTLLEQSGATTSLAMAVLNVNKDDKSGATTSRGPRTMAIVGYLVGLPIFCDSGFVVLSGLMRSLSARSAGQHIWMVLALASSLYSVHCLVPPHPGITAAAGSWQVDLGLLMGWGALVALPVAVAGYFLARWFNTRHPMTGKEAIATESEKMMVLPSATLALLPIIVPILLIGGKSVMALSDTLKATPVWSVMQVLGEPIVALLVGILLVLPLFRQLTREKFNTFLETALAKSGNILLVTAAGGAFGEVIKALDLGGKFGPALAASGLGLLVPFLLAVLFKTAQGSSTVAVIASAGILAALLPSLGLDSEMGRVFALLAMGAGSMAVSHTNDSYFWVVANFSDLDTSTMLSTYSVLTLVMGTVGLICIWALWLFAGYL